MIAKLLVLEYIFERAVIYVGGIMNGLRNCYRLQIHLLGLVTS